MKVIDKGFYEQEDVTLLAKKLLGKIIRKTFNDETTMARIVETEAYNGIIDKASHAYGNRHTKRTSVMYEPGGTAYVYLCYGIHHLFNVITNKPGVPHAVLIRAAEPLTGIPVMLRRMNKPSPDYTLTRGPGNVSRALGISKIHSGEDLSIPPIELLDDGLVYPAEEIIATKRIGVDYAAEDALLPYRFIVASSKYLSGNKMQNSL